MEKKETLFNNFDGGESASLDRFGEKFPPKAHVRWLEHFLIQITGWHVELMANAYLVVSPPTMARQFEEGSGSIDLDVTSPSQINRKLFLKQLAVDLCTSEQRILFQAQYILQRRLRDMKSGEQRVSSHDKKGGNKGELNSRSHHLLVQNLSFGENNMSEYDEIDKLSRTRQFIFSNRCQLSCHTAMDSGDTYGTRDAGRHRPTVPFTNITARGIQMFDPYKEDDGPI
ncbi:hypothetical protein GIB67_012906 [Kingdonia uniflora]|uniref:Uncharacterized protein n=1 Tax=Kingdonia uniflora TaxID=39325 RepID=A0A7J7NFJ0_9MAGN|nr:hypothetical protein GIB67_012906 [Kingdonia uniflora]